MVANISKYPISRSIAKAARIKGGKYLDTKGRVSIWDGKKLKCEHGRERSRCKDCGQTGICVHGRKKSICKPCGGASI